MTTLFCASAGAESAASVETPANPTAAVATAPPAADPLQDCVTAHDSARTALQQHNLIQIRHELSQCASEGCPIAIRAECAEWLTLAERQVPTLVFSATTGSSDIQTARVLVDGVLATEKLDGHPVVASPGPHVVTFELSDGQRQQVPIVVGLGEKDRMVRAEFAAATPNRPNASTPPATMGSPVEPPPAAATRQRDLGVVLGLVALGGAITAASLLYVGISERDETSKRCAPFCTDSEVIKVRRWFILADVVGVTSAIAGGVGIYLYVTGVPVQNTPTAGVAWQREF